MSTKHKTIVITGCPGSKTALGGSLADQLLKKGHTVIGVGRRPKREIKTTTGLEYIQADITQENQTILDHLQTHHDNIDVLIHNAIEHTNVPLFEKTSEDFLKELSVGLVAPLTLSNHIARAYWKPRNQEDNVRSNVNIINISSTAGLKIYKGRNQGTYATIKAGLNMLTWHMAEEYYATFGVRVNAVAPNSIPAPASYEQVVAIIEQLMTSEQNGDIVTTERI